MQAFIGTASLMLLCTLLEVHSLQVFKELQTALEQMKKWKCEEELYTPRNVEVQCAKTAINCFDKELENIKVPCSKGHANMMDIIQDIHNLVLGVNSFLPLNDSLCACENYEVTHFNIYREEFLNLARQLAAYVK